MSEQWQRDPAPCGLYNTVTLLLCAVIIGGAVGLLLWKILER